MIRTALRHRAFTLVELLVVMGVIVILASLLLAVLPGIRRQMEVVKCAGQLAQFGKAALLYAQDWQGVLPSNTQLRGDPYQNGTTLAGEADYFFNGYLQISLTRYRACTAANLDPYFKCPAMVKLTVDDPSRSSAPAYQYVYRGLRDNTSSWGHQFADQVLNTRQNGRRFVLFCGSSAEPFGNQGTGYDISPAANGDKGPQFPHYALNPTGDLLGTYYRIWYNQKVNVLRLDGSVPLLTWLKNSSDPKFDTTKQLITQAPAMGTPNYTEWMCTWRGRDSY